MYNSVYFLRGVYVSHVTNLKSQFSMLQSSEHFILNLGNVLRFRAKLPHFNPNIIQLPMKEWYIHVHVQSM